MSVDLTHPDIVKARDAILTKGDPTTWLLLAYGSPPSCLRLLASGADPAVIAVRDQLMQMEEEVVFGYLEMRGKGLVLAFLRDSVGGMRRAKAVVHSRAVATLFPDYAALMTIAHPSQLSEEEVHDKLGFYAGPSSFIPSQPLPEPSSAQPTFHSSLSRPAPIGVKDQGGAPSSELSPPVPTKEHPVAGFSSPTPHAVGVTDNGRHGTGSVASGSVHSASRSQLSLTDRQPALVEHSNGLAGDLSIADPSTQPRHVDPTSQDRDVNVTTPSDQPTPLPLAAPSAVKSSQRVVSAPAGNTYEPKGISSADLFDDQRPRKTSLTSRLGHLGYAFGRPKQPIDKPPTSQMEQLAPSPPSPSRSPRSPHNPNITKFMNSSLIKNFGRKPSVEKGPVSPVTGVDKRQSMPPPPPPKDNIASSNDFVAYPTFRLQDHTLASGTTSFVPSGGHLAPDDPSGAELPPNGEIARSPSGQKALFDISQKRVRDESEIQERFRRDEEERRRLRDEEERHRLRGGGGRDDAADEDSWGPRKTLMGDVLLAASRYGEPTPAIPERYRADNVDRRYLNEEDDDVGLPYDRPEDPVQRPDPTAINHTWATPPGLAALGAPMPTLQDTQSASTHTGPNANGNGRIGTPAPALALDGPVDGLEPHSGLSGEIGADESVTAQIAGLGLAEEGLAGGEAVGMSLKAERHAERLRADRVKDGGLEDDPSKSELHARRAEEERRRYEMIRGNGEVQWESQAHEEELGLREEQRLEEERTRSEARQREEERRRQEERREEEERQQDETRLREEQRRQEEERRAEEERQKDEESAKEQARLGEERRIEEAKQAEEEARQHVEAERQRREGMYLGLRRNREEGGKMASGFITVQSSKSTLWRRRYFTLYPTDLRLFKAEQDDKPIDTVPVGHGTRLDLTFEESQVQGSFKLTGPHGDEWFMFTDRPEEREVILAALEVINEGR